VAAELAGGRALAELGSEVEAAGLVRLPAPVVRRPGDVLEAEVVLVDHFGNVQLAAPGTLLAEAGFSPGRHAGITGPAGGVTVQVGLTFGSVPVGDLVLYVDAARMAAVAVNGGNAAARLGVRPGDILQLHPVV
jgi:S-adenosylmethionine hydrolase